LSAAKAGEARRLAAARAKISLRMAVATPWDRCF
jgi:hypothetical protein